MGFSKPMRRVRNGAPSQYYWVRVSEKGRRTWKSTKQETMALAREVVETWRLRSARGERHVEDLSLAEAARRWLATKEPRVSPGCYTVYRVYVGHWEERFGERALRSLEPGDLEKYFAGRKKLGVKSRTLNDERSILRSVLGYAMDNGWLLRNPIAVVKKFPEVRRQVRSLEEAEEEKLLKECLRVGEGAEELHAFVLCLLRSGFRRGLVRRVEWEHIDWDRGEWAVPGALMKSREDFTGRPIEPGLLEHLKARRQPAGLIFGNLDIGKFRLACKRAGVPWLKPHDARRTFVSRCRRRGVPMEACMRLSDHRDLAVVLGCYREVKPEELRDAMARAFGEKARGSAAEGRQAVDAAGNSG